MDTIHIRNLEVFANHGVYEEETRLGQKFIVNADLYTDFTGVYSPGPSKEHTYIEELGNSIHYGIAAKSIVDFLQKNTFKLIETAVQELADHLLLHTENLKSVRIELKKPWAPVKYTMETVSVEIERGWHRAYLSLGSNLGSREQYLGNGLNALKSHPKIKLGKISPFYETAPYGGVEQDNFLNCCVEIHTILEPLKLLEFLNETEAENQRERSIHWGPRTLDMDILLYDELIMHGPKLSIPHIDMHNRLFVLQPLKDIAPFAYHPVKRDTVQGLYESLLKALPSGEASGGCIQQSGKTE